MAAAQAIERRADDVLGVETRRLFYAEMLPGTADLLKPHIFRNTAPPHRLLGTAMWPKTRRLLGQVFAATPTAAADSRARLEVELDWLDDRLADGRYVSRRAIAARPRRGRGTLAHPTGHAMGQRHLPITPRTAPLKSGKYIFIFRFDH